MNLFEKFLRQFKLKSEPTDMVIDRFLKSSGEWIEYIAIQAMAMWDKIEAEVKEEGITNE